MKALKKISTLLFIAISIISCNSCKKDKLSKDSLNQIECGGNETFFIKNDNSLWAAGYNFYGQLGDGKKSKFNGGTYDDIKNRQYTLGLWL